MTSLSIGGGSYKGFCFIGALDYLDSKNYLSLLNEFHGTSIGSFIGILYIIGVKPIKILKYYMSIDFKNLWDFNINNITDSYSILSDKVFSNYFINFFKEYEDINITIQDFINKYNIDINIYAVSLTKRKIINFNCEEYKNVKIVDALTASASIPLLFPPVVINGEYFVDGCLKSLDGIIHQHSTGYTIRIKQEKTSINNLNDYISQLFCATLETFTPFKSNINTLDIIVTDKFKNKINFNDIKTSDIIELYYIGFTQSKQFYK